MFDGIIDGWKEGIAEGIVSLLEGQNNQINILSGNLSQDASTYSPEAFDVVMQIAENVMLPIAGVVLTYVAVHELIDMVVNNNRMHDSTTLDIMRWIFKTTIAILLVSNSFTIVSAIIEVGGQLVVQAIPYAETITSQESALALESQLLEFTFSELIMLWMTTALNWLLFNVLKLVINLFIIGRIVEIYMYLSVAPIPAATVANRELQDTGINYTKNVIAVALQGVIILIAISVYNALTLTFTNTNTLSGDFFTIAGGILESLTLTAVLAVAIGKSKGIAKSIVGAR